MWPRLMVTCIKLPSVRCVGHKHFTFDLDRKLNPWLKFTKRQIEKTTVYLLFSLFIQFSAIEIRSLFPRRLPSKYDLRNSSDTFLLSYPRFKSKATLGDRSVTCATPKLWNVPSFDIRSASTVSSLKAKLKTHLFRRAFLS